MKHIFISLLLVCNSLYAQIENDTVFTTANEQPEFPGGFVALAQFVNKNLSTPTGNCEAFGCKTFWIRFTITSSGEVKDVSVKTSVADCPSFENELARVFKLMPNWKPGKQNDKPVNCYFNLPIRIRLG